MQGANPNNHQNTSQRFLNKFGITNEDTAYLNSQNINLDEVTHQLNALNSDKQPVNVVEAATLSNGYINALTPKDAQECINLYETSLSARKFVIAIPAAGAASRQFKLLKTLLNNPHLEKVETPESILKLVNTKLANPEQLGADPKEQSMHSSVLKEIANDLENFWDGIKEEKFAFIDELDSALQQDGLSLTQLIDSQDIKTIAKYILEPKGLGYAERPKALLKFHSYPSDSATTGVENRLALEEHLRRSAELLQGAEKCQLHFMISQDHETLFNQELAKIMKNPAFVNHLAKHGFKPAQLEICLLYTSPSPRDKRQSRMPSSA